MNVSALLPPLTALLGFGLEQFVQSEYGFLGLLLLAGFTLLWSAERKSSHGAVIGVVLTLLVLAQA
ncbi:hypothetical protein [Streptomyces sp. KL116D]|uniref:hypothetical protein n=1 Tax=Streptomyces sp. KL116D TaxID=3045152 RepID=UPI003558CABF